MRRKRFDEETAKIHVHLFQSDLDWIDTMFCRHGQRTIGRAQAIRSIIRAFRLSKEKEINANAKPIQPDPTIADLL